MPFGVPIRSARGGLIIYCCTSSLPAKKIKQKHDFYCSTLQKNKAHRQKKMLKHKIAGKKKQGKKKGKNEKRQSQTGTNTPKNKTKPKYSTSPCTLPVPPALVQVELVVCEPVRGLGAHEAVVQAPPGPRGHHRRRAPDADHAAVRQDVGAPHRGARHAQGHGTGVGVSREPLGSLRSGAKRVGR